MYLLILPLFVSFLLLFSILREKETCWRSVVLSTSVAWGFLLTILTEVLSLFRLLTFSWILFCWLSFCVGLGFACYKTVWRKRKASYKSRSVLEQDSSFEQKSGGVFEPRLRNQIFGVFGIIAISGLIALIAPPNINDSLGYHMPRVMHWIQNYSVAHFPTNYAAQLFLSPWSTYAILHLQVLSGGDQYANFVQWFSMIGSLIGVSLLAKQLGATPYGQAFASIVCATIPMGILQSSSTQNDYVAAFWLICLAHYILLAVQGESTAFCYLLIGSSLGLALLTKGTTYIYSFPFLFWLLIYLVRVYRLAAWKPLTQVGVPTLLINAFLYWRNFEVFHSPLGKSPDYITYTNKVISFPTFLSNIIRNIALHFSTPSPRVNQFLISFWTALHSVLQVDINDPRTSSSNFQLNSLVNHGDLAGNPFHLLLIVISITCFSLNWKRFSQRHYLLRYLFCLVSGFLLFCLALAWTPFHTRLHLPIFILFSPFIACILSKLWNSKLLGIAASILVFLSFTWLLFDENKPVIANSSFLETGRVENIFNTSRLDLYFLGRPDTKRQMMAAAEYIRSQECQDIGTSFNHLDVNEYPLWILLKSAATNENQSKTYQLNHVDVDNASSMKYQVEPFKKFVPCLIYDTHYGKEEIALQGNTYTQAFFSPPVTIFLKK